MELLCVLAAVAALFCGCAVLTLKCRVPASVAPLTALSAIAAVLTLAATAALPRRVAAVSSLSGGRRLGRGVLQGQHRRGAAPFHPGQRAVLGHGAGVHGLLFRAAAYGDGL